MSTFHLDKPNAKWLGVCAGIGNSFGLDPVLVRVLTVVLALCTSLVPVLLLYLLVALLAKGR